MEKKDKYCTLVKLDIKVLSPGPDTYCLDVYLHCNVQIEAFALEKILSKFHVLFLPCCFSFLKNVSE